MIKNVHIKLIDLELLKSFFSNEITDKGKNCCLLSNRMSPVFQSTK